MSYCGDPKNTTDALLFAGVKCANFADYTRAVEILKCDLVDLHHTDPARAPVVLKTVPGTHASFKEVPLFSLENYF